MSEYSYTKHLASEFVGTAGLLAAVVGSGIMAERLAGGNDAIALLANTAATGSALFILILTFGPISGAHFNPAVTLAEAFAGRLKWKNVGLFLVSQITGAAFGTVLANLMFELPAINVSIKQRAGYGQFLGEIVATFGLILVIQASVRFNPTKTAAAVAAYISAAYWFTSSTSFANPAVTFARTLSDTFTGIAPQNVVLFIIGQLIGAVAAVLFGLWIFGKPEKNDN